MQITYIHSLDGDTYVSVWSHMYRPLANVNMWFVFGLIPPLFSNIPELQAFVKNYNLVVFLTDENNNQIWSIIEII